MKELEKNICLDITFNTYHEYEELLKYTKNFNFKEYKHDNDYGKYSDKNQHFGMTEKDQDWFMINGENESFTHLSFFEFKIQYIKNEIVNNTYLVF